MPINLSFQFKGLIIFWISYSNISEILFSSFVQLF